MRQYRIEDMGGCQSLWWAENFPHAIEQWMDDPSEEELYCITDTQLERGVVHCDMWDFVYDHLKHFGAIPIEYEDSGGTVWSIDDIILEMSEEEHLLANAMINSSINRTFTDRSWREALTLVLDCYAAQIPTKVVEINSAKELVGWTREAAEQRHAERRDS